MTVDVIKEGIDGMIRAGHYRDREALLYEAFRTMIEVNPAIRSEVAVELYKSEKISLARAAEIAGISAEGLKKLLEMRGVKRVVAAPSKELLDRGVELILE
jgi:hypothetical protein